MVRVVWGDLETAEVGSRGAGRQPKTRRRWVLAGLAVAVVMVAAVYLARSWPFTQANVMWELEQATSSRVRISAFHRTFFPRPGCVADGVKFVRGDDPKNQSVMTVEKLTI